MWHGILADLDPIKAGNILVAKNTATQTVVGFLSFGSADKGSSAQAEPRAIYIDPQCWSQGIGQRLWEVAQRNMVHAKCSTAVVEVFAGNDRAIRFYQRAGFKENQAGQTVVGSVTLPTLQLIKTLE